MVTVQAVPPVNVDVGRALKEDRGRTVGKHAHCQHQQPRLVSCAHLCSSECKTFAVCSAEVLAYSE